MVGLGGMLISYFNFSFTQAAVKLRKSGGSVYERLFIVKKHHELSSRKTPINNLSKF